MSFKKFSLDELDIEFVFCVRDELQKTIGGKAAEAISVSGFLNRLHENSTYVHHFDEKYWADYVLKHYEKRNDLPKRI